MTNTVSKMREEQAGQSQAAQPAAAQPAGADQGAKPSTFLAGAVQFVQ